MSRISKGQKPLKIKESFFTGVGLTETELCNTSTSRKIAKKGSLSNENDGSLPTRLPEKALSAELVLWVEKRVTFLMAPFSKQGQGKK